MQGTARSNRSQGESISRIFLINQNVSESLPAQIEEVLKRKNSEKLQEDSPYLVKFCFSKEYQELSKNQKSEFETIFKGNLKQKID